MADIKEAITKIDIKSLIKKGHNVQVITSKLINTKSYEKKLGVKIHRPFPLNNIGKTTKIKILLEKIFFNIKLYKFMKLFIKENKIDIIYNQAYPLTFVASIIGSKNNIPLVVSVGSYTEINFKNLFYNRFYLFHVLKQFLILKLSRYEALRCGSKFLYKNLYGHSRKKIFIIPSPVDDNIIRKVKDNINVIGIRKELGILEEEKFLLFVGALEPVKNVRGLINVLPELNIKYKLIIVGEGTEKESIIKLIESLSLNDKVYLTGQLKQLDVFKYMKSCDIFIQSSHTEAFNNSIIEALCLGAPVISTKTGVAYDLVHPNLYTVTEVDEIVDLLDSNILREPNESLINLYSLSNISDQYERMFKETILKHGT